MHWETVTPLLREILVAIMQDSLFDPFRLVGGTALSLQRGHRISVDIDLFTDADYGTINIDPIDIWFRERFEVVDTHHVGKMGVGNSFFVGHNPDEQVKVDVYYTEKFIREDVQQEGIRMADEREIAAMKMGIVGQGARKKDFWDLHDLHNNYSIEEMIQFYLEREPYGFSKREIREGLINFSVAEDEFNPHCLKGKYWELIKYDFLNWLAK